MALARRALEAARELRLPKDVHATLARVAKLVSGDAPRPDDALALLAPLRRPDFADGVLARGAGEIPGVGPKRATQLARRGLATVGDLVFHLPSRYDDRRERTAIGALEVGRRATFSGEVMHADFGPPRGRSGRVFQAVVGDGTGTVQLKWFRAGDALQQSICKGARLLATGDVRRYRFAKEVIHPEVDVLGPEEDLEARAVGVVPDYPTPEGIPPRTFRRWVTAAVETHADLVPEHLPEDVAARRDLPPLADALRRIHLPEPDADPQTLRDRDGPLYERLVLEELYLLEVGLLRRQTRRAEAQAPAIDPTREVIGRAARSLPFELTEAQRRSGREILRDMARPQPMSRLLQGDVGSGKTAVAWLAAVAAAASGLQTALMAPTELLAEQHHRSLARLDAAGTLRTALLTSSRTKSEAKATRDALAAGEVDLVVGTHALVQDEVRFAALGLAIVDEQHRFGVRDRATLAAKGRPGEEPHVLVMTATPIPRSLALTLYGDLELSVIDELPPGREPVRTILLRSGEGARATELVREALDRGEQVYVVYPLVEESEKVDLRDATESAARIQRAFADVRVELVHGRQSAAERGAAMARFEEGETRILVATTVIEVGVDVANATLMIVEHAERFGLAQLHQLRGRVGRGERRGTCVLVARAGGEDSEARLRAMLETTDGFRIADADLRIRGPGEFLGTRQSGRLPDLWIADLVRDARLVAVAREAARVTLTADPTLAREPALARAVRSRFGDRLSLAGVG